MAIQGLPFLGTFSVFPTEIRLLVWQCLFDAIQNALPNHTEDKANPLSILCASQYLYNEVSSQLYRNAIQGIALDPKYNEEEWMKVRLESSAIKIDLVFRNKTETEHYFQTFPHRRTKTIVYIAPPAQDDPGQVVLMWQKTTALVDLLVTTTSIERVHMYPVGSWEAEEPPPHWKEGRDAFFEMGGMQETLKSPYRYHPDHDIAMLPFLHPRLWVKTPEKTVPEMSDDAFDHLRHHLLSLFNPKGLELRFDSLWSLSKDIAVSQIERILIETDIFLENTLDELPGETASFLRLERYKNWFKDGSSWESPYEDKFFDKMSICPWAVTTMDPWLAQFNMRYVILILAHSTMMFAEHEHELIKRGPMELGWDSRLWMEKFPHGIWALSRLIQGIAESWHDSEHFWILKAYANSIVRHRERAPRIEYLGYEANDN